MASACFVHQTRPDRQLPARVMPVVEITILQSCRAVAVVGEAVDTAQIIVSDRIVCVRHRLTRP